MSPEHPRDATAAADEALLRDLDRGFARVANLAQDWLVCRAGCSDCCHGPFPITRLDAWRLRRGIETMRLREPARAAAITTRARAATRQLAENFPGDPRTGRPDGAPDLLDPFFEKHRNLACPALDPDRGFCELHDARPVACRTYGPPLKFGERDVEPCRLCFSGAPDAVVEACRFEPDPEGLEAGLLQVLGAREDEPWETLIAFVLAED